MNWNNIPRVEEHEIGLMNGGPLSWAMLSQYQEPQVLENQRL